MWFVSENTPRGVCTPKKPNVFLFLADDLGYDDIGFNGNTQVVTPTVDEFANNSVAFSRMYTPTAMCSPARAVLYSGRYPLDNGVYMNHGYVKPKMLLLPDYLYPLGYNFWLFGKDHVGLSLRIPTHRYQKAAPLEAMGRLLKPALGNRTLDMPGVVVVYASKEPHGPHQLNETLYGGKRLKIMKKRPATWQAQAATRGYYSDINAMDREFKKYLGIVRTLRQENDVVIFASDHGSGVYAKWSCYEAGLKVPFFVQHMGPQTKPRTVSHLASFVDILPTFIELAGGVKPSIQQEEALSEGRSIVRFLENEGATLPNHKHVFGIHTNLGTVAGSPYPIRSVSDGKFKLIVNPNWQFQFQDLWYKVRWFNDWLFLKQPHKPKPRFSKLYVCRPRYELYNLEEDPHELKNLAAPAKGRGEEVDEETYDAKRRLELVLNRWLRQQKDTLMGTELAASKTTAFEAVPCSAFSTRLAPTTTTTSTTSTTTTVDCSVFGGKRATKWACKNKRPHKGQCVWAASAAGSKRKGLCVPMPPQNTSAWSLAGPDNFGPKTTEGTTTSKAEGCRFEANGADTTRHKCQNGDFRKQACVWLGSSQDGTCEPSSSSNQAAKPTKAQPAVSTCRVLLNGQNTTRHACRNNQFHKAACVWVGKWNGGACLPSAPFHVPTPGVTMGEARDPCNQDQRNISTTQFRCANSTWHQSVCVWNRGTANTTGHCATRNNLALATAAPAQVKKTITTSETTVPLPMVAVSVGVAALLVLFGAAMYAIWRRHTTAEMLRKLGEQNAGFNEPELLWSHETGVQFPACLSEVDQTDAASSVDWDFHSANSPANRFDKHLDQNLDSYSAGHEHEYSQVESTVASSHRSSSSRGLARGINAMFNNKPTELRPSRLQDGQKTSDTVHTLENLDFALWDPPTNDLNDSFREALGGEAAKVALENDAEMKSILSPKDNADKEAFKGALGIDPSADSDSEADIESMLHDARRLAHDVSLFADPETSERDLVSPRPLPSRQFKHVTQTKNNEDSFLPTLQLASPPPAYPSRASPPEQDDHAHEFLQYHIQQKKRGAQSSVRNPAVHAEMETQGAPKTASGVLFPTARVSKFRPKLEQSSDDTVGPKPGVPEEGADQDFELWETEINNLSGTFRRIVGIEPALPLHQMLTALEEAEGEGESRSEAGSDSTVDDDWAEPPGDSLLGRLPSAASTGMPDMSTTSFSGAGQPLGDGPEHEGLISSGALPKPASRSKPAPAPPSLRGRVKPAPAPPSQGGTGRAGAKQHALFF